MAGKRETAPFNAVGESVDLMKKMWGMAGLPGLPNPGNLASMAVRLPRDLPSMVAPTLDLDELDKRIADLRAVGHWLELNANMLRATIQTLEVQRATIATLKGISGAMMTPMIGRAARPETTPPEVELGLRAMATEPAAAPQASAAVAPAARPRKRTRPKKTEAPPADTPVNPAAWWSTLQDQFARIAASAAQAAAPAASAAPAAPKEAKRKKRPSRKKSA